MGVANSVLVQILSFYKNNAKYVVRPDFNLKRHFDSVPSAKDYKNMG